MQPSEWTQGQSQYRQRGDRMFVRRLIMLGVAGVALAYSPALFLSRPALIELTSEDHVIENLAPYFWFVGAAFFFVTFVKYKAPSRFLYLKSERNLYLLLLSLVCVLGGGEEISWGQRVFGLRTPAVVESHNVQGELNIHNLEILNGVDRTGVPRHGWKRLLNFSALGNMFWFVSCLLIPLMNSVAAPRDVFRRWGVPVCPLGIGLLLMANYMTLKVTDLFIVGLNSPLTEIMETNVAFLFFLASAAMYADYSGSS